MVFLHGNNDLCIFQLDVPVRHSLRRVPEQRLVVEADALAAGGGFSSDVVEVRIDDLGFFGGG